MNGTIVNFLKDKRIIEDKSPKEPPSHKAMEVFSRIIILA
jgi:hypothetical protein